jgi:hypothetical protein
MAKDSRSLRLFLGLGADGVVPDDTTLVVFRRRVCQRVVRPHRASRSTRLEATDGALARRRSGARSGATPERSHQH